MESSASLPASGFATLEIAETPPSLNVHARGGHWRYHTAKKHWTEAIGQQLMIAQSRGELPRRVHRVKAVAVVTFKQRRTRDPGNFRFMLEKALGDALTGGKAFPDGRWLPDDDEEHYKFGSCRLDVSPGVSHTTLKLRWWQSPA